MAKSNPPKAKEVFRELGPRLSEQRKKTKLSQARLAEAAGLGQTAVSKLENGTRGVEAARLILMLKEIGERGGDVGYIVTGHRRPALVAGDEQIILSAVQKALVATGVSANQRQDGSREPPRARHKRSKT